MEIEDRSINEQTLATLTLFFGWLGSHKFYVKQGSLGAMYVITLIIGIVLTVYHPVHAGLTIPYFDWRLSLNIGLIVLALPFAASLIEYFIRRQTYDFESDYNERTEENQTIVFITQAIMLVLLFVPVVVRALT